MRVTAQSLLNGARGDHRHILADDRLQHRQNCADLVDVVTLGVDREQIRLEFEKLPGLAGGDAAEDRVDPATVALIQPVGAKQLGRTLPVSTFDVVLFRLDDADNRRLDDR